MKQFKKYKVILLVCAIAFSLASCFDLDVEPRTQETEQSELSQYLGGLITQGYDVDTTALGVYYVMLEEGEGAYPKSGDTLIIGYAGYFVDGTLFETTFLNTSDSTYSFQYLVDRLIPGFEDGIKLMNKGTRLQMVIPSSLAYGADGTISIPSYASLIFVTKMVDIKSLATAE